MIHPCRASVIGQVADLWDDSTARHSGGRSGGLVAGRLDAWAALRPAIKEARRQGTAVGTDVGTDGGVGESSAAAICALPGGHAWFWRRRRVDSGWTIGVSPGTCDNRARRPAHPRPWADAPLELPRRNGMDDMSFPKLCALGARPEECGRSGTRPASARNRQNGGTSGVEVVAQARADDGADGGRRRRVALEGGNKPAVRWAAAMGSDDCRHPETL
jgi:hypothetical protein